MTTEKEERIASFIKANPGLTAMQMAQMCDVSRTRIYEIVKKYNLSYKKAQIGRKPKGMECGNIDRSLCAGRPYSCFNCPNADCICYDAATDIEASFVFLGLQSEERKDEPRKKLEVFK